MNQKDIKETVDITNAFAIGVEMIVKTIADELKIEAPEFVLLLFEGNDLDLVNVCSFNNGEITKHVLQSAMNNVESNEPVVNKINGRQSKKRKGPNGRHGR